MGSKFLLTFVLYAYGLRVTAETIQPIVVPPSLHWDGDDGQWSTFWAQIGTPPQAVRLLPGTSVESSTVPYVVIPVGCADVNPTLANCADVRGGNFQSNISTSWSTQGLANHQDGAIYSLVLVEENKLGIAGNGSYGFDTFSLGVGNNLPTVHNQLTAGVWTNDFFLGILPLSPLPFNYTFTDSTPSMLESLRNMSMVPSLSWAYTAGAVYQDSTTSRFGSLTLGGYDANRFEPNNVSFSFGSDVTRDLLLKLNSITYDSAQATPLMASSVNIFIDSLISEIWLPVSVCQAFEQAFNLTYDEQGEVYFVDDDTYDILLRQNPTFTFTLSNGSETVDIKLPYASFDLNLTFPIVGNATRYFPIKQGQNESQYILGRTFLQEAYVIADYEHNNFSVSQALFQSTSVGSKIIAIEVNNASGSSGNHGLGAGAIAGIAVGAVVVVALIVAALLFWRRRKYKEIQQTAASTDYYAPEKEDQAPMYSSARESMRKVADEPAQYEMESPRPRAELMATQAHELGEKPVSDRGLRTLRAELPEQQERRPQPSTEAFEMSA